MSTDKHLVWLPYTLAADLEVEMNTVFSQNEYASVMAAITAAGIADSVDEKLDQMRAATLFLQTLTKEVLLVRCERLELLGKVLKNIHEMNNSR
jgi:hypothetical protein